MRWIDPSLCYIRLAADLSLAASFPVLWYRMRTKGFEHISLETQLLNAIVFASRYVDLLAHFVSTYNTAMKIYFLLSAAITVFALYRAPRPEPVQHKLMYAIILPSFAFACVYNYSLTPEEVYWTFSQYLSALAFVPQLLALKKAEKVDHGMRAYLLCVFAFGAIYIPHWIVRYNVEYFFDPIAVFSRLVNLAIFIGFAVYLRFSGTNKSMDAEKQEIEGTGTGDAKEAPCFVDADLKTAV